VSQPNDLGDSRNKKVKGHLYYLNIIMAAFYVFAAVLIFLYPPQILQNSGSNRILISVVLFVYGIFRAYRVYKYK